MQFAFDVDTLLCTRLLASRLCDTVIYDRLMILGTYNISIFRAYRLFERVDAPFSSTENTQQLRLPARAKPRRHAATLLSFSDLTRMRTYIRPTHPVFLPLAPRGRTAWLPSETLLFFLYLCLHEYRRYRHSPRLTVVFIPYSLQRNAVAEPRPAPRVQG